MSGISAWERQRREVNAYNLFYSALTPRSTPSLAEHGVRLPVMFPEIEDRTKDIVARPDFVLYDGATCLFAEIKAGNNITDRDIRQMRACASVDIETAEGFLRDAQVRRKTGYDGTVASIEACIVYQDMDEDYVEDYYEKSEDFQESLDALVEHAVLMTQDYGGELRILAGEFTDDGGLQSVLSRGVELPENPPDTVMLTEGMEEEVLAVAICDIWGERAVDHDDPIEVTTTEVRDYFAPRHNVSPGNVDRVFEFLDDFGACDHVDENRYQFGREHLTAVLRVEEAVREQRVDEYLREDGQSTFEMFDRDENEDDEDDS